MNRSVWKVTRVLALVVIGVGLIAGVAAAAWSFSSVNHLAIGQHQKTVAINVDFNKFRQIMIRKNATAAIVDQSGMTLIDERVHDVHVDTSGDDRPLLNALRGKSQSEVGAVKQITVRLNDPAINASELVLRQHAVIEADSMTVETNSKSPAGNLEEYETTLNAKPDGNRTQVQLSVAMKVRVDVPKMFVDRADTKVQKSAEDSVNEQAESIEAFVAEYAGKRFILPDLGRDR